MKQYLNLCKTVLEKGTLKENRTGTSTISVFGHQERYDLSEGFPLLTTKKVHLKSIIHELLWFIYGGTNIKYLVDNDVKIWNDWPYKKYCDKYDELLREKYEETFDVYYPNKINLSYILREDKLTMDEFVERIKNDPEFARVFGELGPVYGKQWRDFNGFDQLSWVIKEIKNNPDSRRLIVNSWNASEVDKMALPPCHMMFQFYVNEGKLSLHLYQRSADVFLGVPFNIASYASAMNHIYTNHLEQINTQLSREPRQLPKMIINKNVSSIFDFKYEDFELVDYNPHGVLKGKVAV